jgi:pyruvate-formate lyase-activating enzyme
MIRDFNMEKESWNQMVTLLDEIRSDQIEQIHLLPYHHIAEHKSLKCGMEYRMKGAENVEKSELLPYSRQLFERGWKKVFIGG